MRVHLIHGIHTSEGRTGTAALLLPELTLAGYTSSIQDYGYVSAITSRWKNKRRAMNILPNILPGDIIIAHSNGCDITRRMLEMGAAPSGIIFLQPALDADTVFPYGDWWMNVFFNKEDKAVFMAKWFLWFHHPYGAMGRYGYLGNDRRIVNYNTLDECDECGGHSEPYRHPEVRERVVLSIK